MVQGQLKKFNHFRFFLVLLSRDWCRANSKHLIFCSFFVVLLPEDWYRASSKHQLSQFLLHSSFMKLVQGQFKIFNHLNFCFLLLSLNLYRAKSKHVIISASSSVFFCETDIGPIQNFKSSQHLRSSFTRLVQGQLKISNPFRFFFLLHSRDWCWAN